MGGIGFFNNPVLLAIPCVSYKPNIPQVENNTVILEQTIARAKRGAY